MRAPAHRSKEERARVIEAAEYGIKILDAAIKRDPSLIHVVQWHRAQRLFEIIKKDASIIKEVLR